MGHVALFEGHSPMLEEEAPVAVAVKESEGGLDGLPEGFFDGLDEFGFGSIQNNSSQEEHLALGLPTNNLDAWEFSFSNLI